MSIVGQRKQGNDTRTTAAAASLESGNITVGFLNKIASTAIASCSKDHWHGTRRGTRNSGGIEREREREGRKQAALIRSENSAAKRALLAKMVANSYTVGMGLTALACIIFPALAIANQRTNSQSVLQR